jgi:V/A-type H+-transporting ATPase subunit E
MDIQVQELIDNIKKDGINSASEEAARIKHNAETEASQILEAAKKEAAQIVARGQQDAERLEKAGKAALEQASRNLLLVFKDEIQALLDRIVGDQTGKAYSEEVLKTVLPDLIKAWAGEGAGADSMAVLLPEASLKKLQEFFKGKLAGQLKKGVELKSDRNLAAGFRIVEKDGSAYYDFTADAVAELLCAYLNPRLAEILKTSAKGI